VDDIAEFFAEPDTAQFDRWEDEIILRSTARRQALTQARSAFALGHVAPVGKEMTTKGTDMTSILIAGTATHIGGREVNEDVALTGDRLFAIADGIGGLGAGQVAARLAVDALDEAVAADRSVAGLLDAGRKANRSVWRHATAGREGREPSTGTTLTALAVTSDAGTVVLHVGDSRLYRLRDGRLAQLTQDHTVVAELVGAGELEEKDVAAHPHRHVLTRAVGAGPEVDLDYAGVSCAPGDRLLLCTDGASRVLSSDDLKAVLIAEPEPHGSAAEIVRRAVACGTDDNVTAVVIAVDRS
jgi:serine/threonine protein phosphatase PrpC